VVEGRAEHTRGSTPECINSLRRGRCRNGAAAWERLVLTATILWITDNKMPRLTRVELLKKLYANRMALPSFMATGELPTRIHRYPWLQPAAMLLKPYTIEELLNVEKVLREADGADDAPNCSNIVM